MLGQLHQSLPESVYQWLRSAISDGSLKPGQMLRQLDLSKQLGVSRVPVREALQRLEGEGLVVLSPRRGYTVTSLDIDEIAEIFELRTMVEGRAATYSTRMRTNGDVARVTALLEEMDRIPMESPDAIPRWSKLNLEFHEALLSCGRPRYMQRLASGLRAVVEPYIRLEASMTGGLAQAQAEHRELVSAFAAGDAEFVARLTREHCEHTATRLLEGLQQKNAHDEPA